MCNLSGPFQHAGNILAKVGIKLHKIASNVISEYCSLFPYFCSSGQSLLLFKFKTFALNSYYNAAHMYIAS